MNRNQKGFSLMAVMVSLVIAGVMSYGILKTDLARTNERAVDKVHLVSNDIAGALKKYRIDRGSWPSSLTELSNRGMMPAENLVPIFGPSYGYTVTNDSNGGYVTLTIPMLTRSRAEALAGRLPHGRVVNQTSASTRIWRAGMEVSLEGLRQEVYNNFYQVDGFTNIRSDVDFRGFSALNLDKVYARAYYDLDDGGVVLDPSGVSIVNELEAHSLKSTVLDTTVLRAEVGEFSDRILTKDFRSTGLMYAYSLNATSGNFTRSILANQATVFNLAITNNPVAGSACDARTSNIGISGSEVVACHNGVWTSNRLKFGNHPPPRSQVIAASVSGVVNGKSDNTVCGLSANGVTIAQGWVGGGHEYVGSGGTVVASNGNVNFSSYGSCMGVFPSINGYFYY